MLNFGTTKGGAQKGAPNGGPERWRPRTVEAPNGGGPEGWRPRTVEAPNGGFEGWEAQNFALFFSSHATMFILFP